jgi:hypothetical protein
MRVKGWALNDFQIIEIIALGASVGFRKNTDF